ncbi:MAG: TonB-dependent receptor [Gammaproteobacteria bacterium]|nr:TonB-dependent receptor [Gammaproteobacteria bacterium]
MRALNAPHRVSLLVSLLLLVPFAFTQAWADDALIEHVIVTGTRIQQAEPAGVVTLDRQTIERSGATTITGLFRDLIYDSAGVVDEQFTQGFAPASAGVDLRGMGVNRTLVLLDGRRLPVFPFGQDGSQSFVDINLIPLAAVERIEVLKDGASAIYGADAVAGVVNIITRSGESGTSVAGRYSAASEGDGEEAYVSVSGGVSVGEAEFGFALDYLDRNPIMARDRDIAASANGPIDDRSSAGNPGTFITSMGPVPDAACPADRLRGPFCTYDFAQDATLVPQVERLGMSASWDQALTPNLGLFARGTFTTTDSERDLAGAPNAYPVGAANPNNPFGEPVLAIYRLLELGPRRDAFETDAYNFVAGISGSMDDWLWEAGAGFSKVDTTINGVSGYAIAADVQAAIDSGALNVFGDSPSFDPASVAYETERAGESELGFVDFKITGNLLEMTHGSVGAAFGAEFRSEDFSDELDPVTASGAVIGIGGTSAEGDRDVWALYAEFVVPVLENVDLQIAGRYDDYSDFGGTFNPKLGVRWQAAEDLEVHASVSTGFKAPALHELYSGEIFAFQSIFDTTNCDAARAANDPVAIAQYCDSVTEVLNVASGNEELDAEESDHIGFGVEWSAGDNLQLGLDYWWVENKNAVTSNAQFYVDNESRFAGNVIRDGGGDIATVLSPFENVAAQELWGLDMNASGRLSLADAGELEARFTAAYLGSFEQQPSAGEPVEDLSGKDGYPEWRAQLSLAWSHSDYAAMITTHYTDGYERVQADDSVGSWVTVDMQVDWAPAALRGGAVALGLDNVFDEEPPEDAFLEGWPFFNRALHDPRGRLFYLRYSHDF